MIKKYLFILLMAPVGSLLSQIPSAAQTDHPEWDFCATDKLYDDHQVKSTHAGHGAERLILPHTLPVVVHIIHDNGPENISDAQVIQGIQHLNEAFANEGYYDQGTGVNTQIQFCLAKRDPDGNATTGINRVQSLMTTLYFTTQDLAMKDLSRWDPLHYINIWLVRDICGNINNPCTYNGYAYLPEAHGAPFDGIVVKAALVGSSHANSSILVHEMGHYLGLRHTFWGGCNNDDCLVDGDMVCDTPPDKSTVHVPCGGSINSCNTDAQSGFSADQPDMFWNYMDYSDWNCYSAFTLGQAERMAFFIDSSRYSLLGSDACEPPCMSPLSAAFTASANIVDAGTTINFANTTINGTSYQWLIDGVPFGAGVNASYVFNTPGIFTITLEAGNADPNCFSSAQDTIEVVCQVSASFTVSTFFPAPGEVAGFSNNSTGGTSFNWSVNGVAEAATPDFSYVFPSQGPYIVCLEAGNGLCIDEQCHILYVYEKSGSCETGYLWTLGNQAKRERALCMVVDSSGNAILGGQKEDAESHLLKVDEDGNILWERSLDILAGPEYVQNMFLDSKGYLVLSGRNQANSPADSVYISKFDLNSQTLVWQWTWSETSDGPPTIEGLFENPANENYIAYGAIRVSGDLSSYILEIAQNNGTPLWQKYSPSQTVLLNHNVGSDYFIFGGRKNFPGGGFNTRATVMKTDLSGNVEWTQAYFPPLGQPGYTQTKDILWEGDTIVALGYGSFTISDPNGLTDAGAHLFKTDMEGNLLWGKSYHIAGGLSLVAEKLLPVPNGYIIQGNYRKNIGSEVFFIRTNKTGNVIWGKSLGTIDHEAASESIVQGNAIYFAGSTNTYDVTFQGAPDILYGKIPLEEADQNDSCSWLHDLDILVADIQPLYDTMFVLSQFNEPFNWEIPSANVEPTSTEPKDVPDCSCPGTLDCTGTFFKAFHTHSYFQKGYRIIPEPGGGFLLGGSKSDQSSMIILLDHEGAFVWERSIQATSLPQGQITDLIIDSDQFLLAVGTAGSNADTTENFAFKYDYQNDSLIWIIRPDTAAFGSGQFNSIREIAPGGSYLIAGKSPSAGATGDGCDALLAELDRGSGSLVWAQNYHLDSCETFSSIVVHANSIYAAGSQTAPGGSAGKLRGAIAQFDLSGNEIWSRLYLADTSSVVEAELHIADLLIDNGIIAAGYGNPDGTSADDSRLQLFKTDFTGNLLWARQYEIPGEQFAVLNRLIKLPDGYLCIGTHSAPDPDATLFLLKTDKNGHLVWARTYNGIGPTTLGYDILLHEGFLYFTGATSHWYHEGWRDVFFARLSLDGRTDKPCDLIQDITVVETDIVEPYQGLHPLTVYTPGLSIDAISGLSFQPIVLEEVMLCEMPCSDSCFIAPDAVVQLLEGACNGDSLNVTLEVCNLGNGILYANTPVAFYEGHPGSGTATFLAMVPLLQNLEKDSCLQWTLSLAGPFNKAIYVLVNAEGYTGFDTLECNRANNLSSFIVNHSPPLLNLGLDTVMCGFGVVSLHATPGFAAYKWFDGAIGPDYTASEPGTYWVIATDSCGGVQTDTVLISVYSSAHSFDTLVFCPGSTAWVFGNPVADPGSYSALFTGFHGCDSLHTIELTLFDSMAIAIETKNACVGAKDGSASVQLSGGSPPYLYDWGEGPTGSSMLDNLPSGAYTLMVQDANGCISEIPFSIGNYAPVNLLLPPDLTLQLGQADQIIPQVFPPGGVFQYAWSPPDGLSCADCPTPFVQPAYNTTYLLVITDTLGCTAQAEIAVNVDLNRRVFIPNTFSPNADGTNDWFTVFGASELLRIRSLRVYDRWGDKVFEGLDLRPNDPSEGWDGTFRGKPMNAAVFGYVAELEFADGVVLVYHGGVGLVR